MRSEKTTWSITYGCKPKERNIQKDNASMPEELRSLGERLRAVEINNEDIADRARLTDVWDE